MDSRETGNVVGGPEAASRAAGSPSRVIVLGAPAQWCIVALLGVVAASLLLAVSQSSPPAMAQTAQSGGEPQGVFAVAGQITRDHFGLYLVDPQRGTLVIYEYVGTGPATGRLRLAAARSFVHDRELEAYNTDKPEPSDVAEMVRQARQVPTTAPSP